MRIGIVGCGFVSQFYRATLPRHPGLTLVGVTDRDENRARSFAWRAGVRRFRSLDELLADESIELVVNLTNPGEHHAVSKAALLAGRHVYSEKPLATNMEDATELVALAKARGVRLSSAPCSLLGDTAQALWRTLRSGEIGPVRVVYAALDDGLVHRMPYRTWSNGAGVAWPYKDEFEVGCTIEHAGYYLTWLVAFFGPARRVTSFASVQVPDKVPGEPLDATSPDFSVACIEFSGGVVARLTCSILAPHDHSLVVVGDEGVVETSECWDYRSAVTSRRRMVVGRRTFLSPIRRSRLAPARGAAIPGSGGAARMDFSLGPAELAASVREGRATLLSAELALHVNELTLAIHGAREGPRVHELVTTVEPLEPVEHRAVT